MSERTNLHREIHKRTPLPAVSVVYEIARKRNLRIRFEFKQTDTKFECQCSCVKNKVPHKIVRADWVSVPLEYGAKKNVKELAANRMLQMLKYI